MIYVVQVTHRVGPDTATTEPILVTENAAVALTAACGADAGGYRLTADGDGAKIFRLGFSKMELAPTDLDAALVEPKTLVFARIRDQRTEKGWFVQWYDTELEQRYSSVFNPLCS